MISNQIIDWINQNISEFKDVYILLKMSKGLEGINSLYKKILEENFTFGNLEGIEYQLYCKALGSVIVTDQSLSIRELEMFLNIKDENGYERSLVSTFQKLQPFLLINNNQVDEETIPRFHKSFVEFITDKQNCTYEKHITIDKSHQTVAKAYLSYLVKNLPHDLETFERIDKEDLDIKFPYLHLAAVECIKHLQLAECTKNKEIKDKLLGI